MPFWRWLSCLKTWIRISRIKKELTGIADRKDSFNQVWKHETVVCHFTHTYIYYPVNTQGTVLRIKNIMVNMTDVFPGFTEFIV